MSAWWASASSSSPPLVIIIVRGLHPLVQWTRGASALPRRGQQGQGAGRLRAGLACLLGPHRQGLCGDTEAPGRGWLFWLWGAWGPLHQRWRGEPEFSQQVWPFSRGEEGAPRGARHPGGSPCPGRVRAEPSVALHVDDQEPHVSLGAEAGAGRMCLDH